MVITFSNIKGSAGGGGGATGGTVSGITLWSDETTKAYIDNALSGVTDVFSAYTKTEDFATINGSAITSGGNIVVEATPYTAGTNIDITDHIISVTGITVPTKVSELVNDKGYITTADTQNFVTSGDVQTQINNSISGKADSSAVTAQISAVKQEIEAKIPSKVSDLQNDLNFASTGDVKTQIDNAVSGKQDTLVSGENIKTINNQSLLGSGNIEIQGGGETYSAGEGIGIDADNIISVTGNYETIVELTQAEYDALTSYGKNTTYVITDAPAVNLSAYTPTSGFSTINGNVITDGGNIEIQGGNAYTAGANIDISTDNVISVTGMTMPTKLSELTNDEGFVNSGEVETQITNKDYPTKNWVQDQVAIAIESETARTESTYAKIGDIPSLDGYATTGWVESQGYLKEHQDISGKLDTSVFTAYTANTQTELSNKQDASAMTEYATTAFTESTYLKEHQSLSAYSTTEQVQTLINTAKQEVENEIPDVSNFITSAQVETQITDKGYLTGYTETDPVFMASAASGITSQDITNWNGKLDSSDLEPYYTSAQTDNAISNAVSGKADSSAVTAQISEVKAQIEAEIPTKVSSLENDLNFVNSGDVKTQVEGYNYINSGQAQTQIDNSISGKLNTDVFTAYTANTQTELNNKQDASGMTAYATTAFTENTYAKIGDIPTKTSDLTNDSGFITNAALLGYATEQYVDNSVSGKVDNSALTQYYTSAQTDTAISNAVSGKLDTSAITAYSTTEEVENMITAATNGLASEEWVNNQGFLKEHQSLSAYSTTEQVQTLINTAKQEVENEIPDVSNFVTSGEVETQITNKGYITGYTETDPVFQASTASRISEQDITNWDNKLDLSALNPYYTSAQTDNAISNATSGKQDTLVSGVNIKTINNESLLGSGNIVIEGGSSIKNYQPLQVEFSPNYSFIDAYEISSIGTQQFYKRIAFDTINGNSIIHQSDNDKVNWTIPTSTSALTNDSGYVTSGEVNTQIESKGYITGYTETDPVFQASAASGITSQDITNWNGKQPSGDYALRSELPTVPTSNTAFTNDAGYITDAALNGYATTAFTEQTYLKEHQSLSAYTPTSGFSTINGNVITDGGNIVIEETSYTAGANIDISTDNVISVTGITVPIKLSELTNDEGFVNSGEVETQIASKGYITGYTESDPVFQASAASGISEQDIMNWNNKLDSSALNPYYTSAQTDTAISNAVSGKTDKVSVTASSGGYKFPKWNDQGCITGISATAYQASQSINGSNRTVYSNSSEALPTIYAPTSEGLAGQPLLSNGSGAPVWGSYKFQFISQSQYDALATKDSTTIYFIVNEN